MASNTVANIHVDLSADTATYKRDLNRARSLTRQSTGKMTLSFKGMERGIGKAFGMVNKLRGGLFALAGVGGLTLLVKRSVESADAIGKIADKVGVSVEALQQLRFAAEQAAGVSKNTFDMALQRLSRRLGEAANGSGELAGTLKQYNISARDADGTTRPVVAVFGDLAEAIKGAESAQEKLRISFKSFDSEGAALVNLMDKGRDGIRKYADDADRMGIILSGPAVRAAAQANDQFGRMSKIIGVNLTRGMISLAPLVIRLGQAFSDLAPQISAVVGHLLPDSMRSSAMLIDDLTGVQDRLGGLRDSYIAAAKAAGSDDAWLKKNADYALALRDRIAVLKGMIVQAKKSEAVISAGLKIGGIKDDGSRGAINSIKRRGDALKFETTLVGKSRVEKAKLQAVEGAIITAKTQGVTLSQTHISQLQFEASRVGVLTGELEGLEKAQRRNEQLARDFGGAFVSAFTRAQQEGGKLSGVLRGLAVDMLRIYSTRTMENGINDLISNGGGGFSKILGGIGSFLSGGGGAFSGSAGGIRAPRRELGGPVNAGQPYIVGEKRPELFVPNRSGTIVPQVSGGGGNTYYIDARGADQGGLARLESMIVGLNGSIEHRAVAAVVDASARNPRLMAAGA